LAIDWGIGPDADVGLSEKDAVLPHLKDIEDLFG
jgi:hypothetical protein